MLLLTSMNLRDYLELKVELEGTSGEGSAQASLHSQGRRACSGPIVGPQGRWPRRLKLGRLCAGGAVGAPSSHRDGTCSVEVATARYWHLRESALLALAGEPNPRPCPRLLLSHHCLPSAPLACLQVKALRGAVAQLLDPLERALLGSPPPAAAVGPGAGDTHPALPAEGGEGDRTTAGGRQEELQRALMELYEFPDRSTGL